MENSVKQTIAYSEFYQEASTQDTLDNEPDIDLDRLYKVNNKEILPEPVLFF